MQWPLTHKERERTPRYYLSSRSGMPCSMDSFTTSSMARRYFYRHPLVGLHMPPSWACLFVHRHQGVFVSVHGDTATREAHRFLGTSVLGLRSCSVWEIQAQILLLGPTTWKGTQKNRRRKKLWNGRQENQAMTQSLHTLRRRPQVEKEWKRLENYQEFAVTPSSSVFSNAHRQA